MRGLEEDLQEIGASNSKRGSRKRVRPADDFNRPSTGRRSSCLDGMTRKGVKRRSETRDGCNRDTDRQHQYASEAGR